MGIYGEKKTREFQKSFAGKFYRKVVRESFSESFTESFTGEILRKKFYGGNGESGLN